MNLKASQIATFVSFEKLKVELSTALHQDISLSHGKESYNRYNSQMHEYKKRIRVIHIQLVILGLIFMVGMFWGSREVGMVTILATLICVCIRMSYWPHPPKDKLELSSNPKLTKSDYETWEESPGIHIGGMIHQLIDRHNDIVSHLSIRLEQSGSKKKEKILEGLIENALELRPQTIWLRQVLDWYDHVQQKYTQMTHKFPNCSSFFWAGEKTEAILEELKKEPSFPAPKSDFIDHSIMLRNTFLSHT